MKKNNNNSLLSTLSRKRYHILFYLTIFLTSCNSKDINDCLQTDGKNIRYEVEVPFFSKLQLEDDIKVVLKQGEVQNVTIETGENIAPEIFVDVLEETLRLRNDNTCNIFRDYGKTLITVTSPNITYIKQASSFPIRSEGVLSYPEVYISSNTDPTHLLEGANKNGDVFLDLNVEVIRIAANGSSNFILNGSANDALFVFSDEYPQLDARNLIVNNIVVRHVSAAQMIVHPIESLKGQVRATGDLISVNRPPVVEVEEFYTGRLLFEE